MDILVYLFKKYPFPRELSKARVVKLLYLIDWRSSILYNTQITKTKWLFNHYGPYVTSIIDLIKDDGRFELYWVVNYYGEPKELIKLKDYNYEIEGKLDERTKKIIDFVIEKTSPLSWTDFINLVYDTYPVRSSIKYSHLDLPKLAREYREVIEARDSDTSV